ncbi:MAG: ROK family protein [Ferruginibacter sp.]|nr:ROK family protein [Ferruginibacter sp.]
MHQSLSGDKILSIDIGGSHIKATILNAAGELQIGFQTVDTPPNPGPEKLVDALKDIVSKFPEYDNVSVGFPGFVKDGKVFTAPSLAPKKWGGIELRQILQDEFNCPVEVVNDADMQGLGIVRGKGFEMVITLGTGLGSALFLNGILLPHLELSQHPFMTNIIYDRYIGKKALEKEGEVNWNKRIQKVLLVLKTVFNYDHLYIGGGNSGKIDIPLDKNITIVSNEDGIKGGAKLWQLKRELELEVVDEK